MTDDQQLLQQYLADGSPRAFEELIQCHLPMVYTAALRQVRNAHLAEDVTQAVFLVLTQKARTIRSGAALAGWLLSVTHYASVNAMKKQNIQKKVENQVARAEAPEPASPEEWEKIAPFLDSEIHSLATADRDALVLRFFQNRSFAEIGGTLGLSEEAARKRVSRAVDTLRGRLARRRNLTAPVLMFLLGAFAVQALPGHLRAAEIAVRIGSPSPVCVSLAKGVNHMLAWTKAKAVFAVAASVVAGVTSFAVVSHSLADQPAPPAGAVQVTVTPGTALTPVSAQTSGTTVSVPAPAAAQTPVQINVPMPGGAPAAAVSVPAMPAPAK